MTKKRAAKRRVPTKKPKTTEPAPPTAESSDAPPAPPKPDRRERIRSLMAEGIRAKHGARSALLLSEGEALSEVKEVLPTTIDALDRWVVGCHVGEDYGLPGGRVVEIAGPEGSGKTTIGWSLVASAQRSGGIGAWVDGEHSMSKERAGTMGASWDDTILLEPDTLEEGLDMVWTALGLIPKGVGPNVIVFDSIAGLTTRYEKEHGETRPGEIARILTVKLRRVGRLLVEKRCVLACMNQVRDDGVGGGGQKRGLNLRTPGGRYFQHAASLRIMITGGEKVEIDGKRVGKAPLFRAQKNRFVEPFRVARVRLIFRTGWDNRWTTINHAREEGKVPSKARFRLTTKAHVEACRALGWPAIDGATGEVLWTPGAPEPALPEEPEPDEASPETAAAAEAYEGAFEGAESEEESDG